MKSPPGGGERLSRCVSDDSRRSVDVVVVGERRGVCEGRGENGTVDFETRDDAKEDGEEEEETN